MVEVFDLDRSCCFLQRCLRSAVKSSSCIHMVHPTASWSWSRRLWYFMICGWFFVIEVFTRSDGFGNPFRVYIFNKKIVEHICWTCSYICCYVQTCHVVSKTLVAELTTCQHLNFAIFVPTFAYYTYVALADKDDPPTFHQESKVVRQGKYFCLILLNQTGSVLISTQN